MRSEPGHLAVCTHGHMFLTIAGSLRHASVHAIFVLAMLVVQAVSLAQGPRSGGSEFPLRVSADRRHLVGHQGQPYLVVGDTAWSLMTQLGEAEAVEYLNDRQGRGFNAVIVSLVEHKFTTNAPNTIDGTEPFTAAGDWTQPNPVYFDHAHRVIAAANERGISIWLCPAYLGVNGGDEGWYQEIDKAGAKVLREYGRYVGGKFKDLPNIVWMPGGDYDVPPEKRWAAEQLALGLRDGGAEQLMTAHGCQKSAVATFGDRDWLAIDNVYSYQPDPWKEHQANYRNAVRRPSVLIEGLYENEYAEKTEPANIRRQAWWAMTSGAAGQFFGNAPIWHLGGPGFAQSNRPWKDALGLAGSRDHARLGAFFRRLPWNTLVPDLDDQLVSAGGGEGSQKITAASDADGRLAVLYVPPGGDAEREFTLNLAKFSGPVSARWFNPAQDTDDRPVGLLPREEGVSLKTLGDNGTGATDWVLVLETPVPAADWPNFGGPHRTNAADGPKLLDEWPLQGPPKVWEVNGLGSGYSAPVVTGEHIFLMSGEESSEFLICLAAETGKLVWKEKVGSLFKNEYGDGPRGSPTVSGGRVFAIGANGDLLAADAATGNRLWSVKLVEDLGGEVPGWGYSESPLVDGDLVICTPGGKQGTLAALEVSSGNVIWRSGQWTDPAMYSSLAVVEIGESRQYVGVTREHVTGVSANSGEVLWQQPFDSSVVVAQAPIIEGDVVYVTASGGTGSRGFRLKADGTAAAIYSNKVMKNLPGGVSSLGGHVYGYSDGSGWICQNLKTGERVWSSRDFPKGTLTIADGKLILLTEETGEVALAVAQTDDLKIASRFELTPQSKSRREQGRVWTVPVVCGGRLYLRDQDYLFCFDLR